MFGSNWGGQEVLQVMIDTLTTYSRDIFRDFQSDLAPLLFTKRCRRVSLFLEGVVQNGYCVSRKGRSRVYSTVSIVD